MTFTRRQLVCTAIAAPLATGTAAARAAESTERPMRRMDRSLTQEQILEAIRRTEHAVLSTADASGTPYGVAITPVYVDGVLYFHSTAQGGRKADNMKQNPRVSVFWMAKGDTDPKAFAVDYVSVVAAGTASLVTDEAEREKAMMAFCAVHASGRTAKEHLSKFKMGGKGIQVWKITISKLTGKSRNPQLYFGKPA